MEINDEIMNKLSLWLMNNSSSNLEKIYIQIKPNTNDELSHYELMFTSCGFNVNTLRKTICINRYPVLNNEFAI